MSKIIEKVRQREAKIAVLHARERFAGMMLEINGERPGQIEQVKASIIDTTRREQNHTGNCTVRELVLEMITSCKGDTCELAFPLPNGRRVNVEVRITRLEGNHETQNS